MANDGFRSPVPPEHPASYEDSDSRQHQASMYQGNNASRERIRPRENPGNQHDNYQNEAARHQQAQQPINEAVTSALGHSGNPSALPPDILNQIASQITANVLQQLKATNPTPQSNVMPPAAAAAAVPMPNTPSTTGSPLTDHRNVYTPPTPHRPSDDTLYRTMSPPISASHAMFGHNAHGRNTPPVDKPPVSPVSQATQSGDDLPREDRGEPNNRPKGPIRLSTSKEETILEKVWGQLFDEDAHPTKRLGQFLRGIAIHLIEDYEPAHSLVITPSKMQKYYEATKVSSELYPWQVVFDDRTSSISRLYREVEAQHHLVQDGLDERPDIPGLTPAGFERWVTLLLLAHPEQEFERLQKAVLDMPISNPDEKQERFPKEISRRLFPKDQDHEVKTKLENAMVRHCNLRLPMKMGGSREKDEQTTSKTRRSNSTVIHQGSPPLQRQDPVVPDTSTRQSSPPGLERERKPYSNVPTEAAIDEEGEDVQTPQPIERERQPYVAQPGAGRNYEDVNRPSTPPDFGAPLKPSRSASISVAQGRSGDLHKSRPISINTAQSRSQAVPTDNVSISESAPNSARHRSSSLMNHQYPTRNTRNRSPSASANYGHRSENDVSYGTGAYTSSYSSSTGDTGHDARHQREYHERDRARQAADRHDWGRMNAYDVESREREARPRFQSTSGLEGPRAHYTTADEEYYRAAAYGTNPGNGYQQYPSSANYR